MSIRPTGTEPFGQRVEIKNLNSFKAVKSALQFEIGRQPQVLTAGQPVVQETRLWEAKAQVTQPMRSKEDASDYRYFPEPDLVPFVVNRDMVKRVAQQLPELPAQRRGRLAQTYGLSAYDAQVLTQFRRLTELFEQVAADYPNPKLVANWITVELLGYVNAQGLEPESVRYHPAWLAHLLEAIDRGTISGKMAKDVFVQSIQKQQDPATLIDEQGLRQIIDPAALERLADEVLANETKSVEAYRGGKANALMFLVGKCMQRSQGKANPQQLTEILKRKLEGGKEVAV